MELDVISNEDIFNQFEPTKKSGFMTIENKVTLDFFLNEVIEDAYIPMYTNIAIHSKPIKRIKCIDFEYENTFCSGKNSNAKWFVKGEIEDATLRESSMIMKSFHNCSNWKNTYDSFNKKEIVAFGFVKQIRLLEEENKIQDSIKEVYKIFNDILPNSSKELLDAMLKHAAKDDFSLPILIAFLAATLPVKNKLSNREILFYKAKALAVKEMGKDKVDKSIFNSLY